MRTSEPRGIFGSVRKISRSQFSLQSCRSHPRSAGLVADTRTHELSWWLFIWVGNAWISFYMVMKSWLSVSTVSIYKHLENKNNHIFHLYIPGIQSTIFTNIFQILLNTFYCFIKLGVKTNFSVNVCFGIFTSGFLRGPYSPSGNTSVILRR